MICPVCKRDMVDIEYNRIELDYCTNCRGVWFDAEELELLVEGMRLGESVLAVDNITGSQEPKIAEKKRKCPICGWKMGKATIGKESRIFIDVCRRGDGLWFDGGEVAQLIKQLIKKPTKEKDSQQRVINFLGEVFSARE